MRAADVMQKPVISVSPELPVAEFEQFLSAEDISGALVMGTDGRARGIASKTDVVRALGEQVPDQLREMLDPDLRVEDIMTRELVAVPPDAPLKEVARRMVDGHVHRVVVLEGDEVVGIISSLDLLAALAR